MQGLWVLLYIHLCFQQLKSVSPFDGMSFVVSCKLVPYSRLYLYSSPVTSGGCPWTYYRIRCLNLLLLPRSPVGWSPGRLPLSASLSHPIYWIALLFLLSLVLITWHFKDIGQRTFWNLPCFVRSGSISASHCPFLVFPQELDITCPFLLT